MSDLFQIAWGLLVSQVLFPSSVLKEMSDGELTEAVLLKSAITKSLCSQVKARGSRYSASDMNRIISQFTRSNVICCVEAASKCWSSQQELGTGRVSGV